MALTVYDYLLNLKETHASLRPKFLHIFKVSLDKFWSRTTGFDIIKFDDFVAPGAHESTNDAVLRQWGEPGVAMVRALIDAQGTPLLHRKG